MIPAPMIPTQFAPVVNRPTPITVPVVMVIPSRIPNCLFNVTLLDSIIMPPQVIKITVNKSIKVTSLFVNYTFFLFPLLEQKRTSIR